MMKQLLAWAQQPTSVAGFSALCGTFSAVILQQITWAQAMPLIAGAVVSIALPDNAGAQRNAETLAGNIVAELNHSNGGK